jgi:hypothetical protein
MECRSLEELKFLDPDRGMGSEGASTNMLWRENKERDIDDLGYGRTMDKLGRQ